MKTFILSFLLILTLSMFAAKAQQNCALSVQGTVKNASCSGGMDGAIQLDVSGGAKPYTFFWSSGQEVKDISQLTEGTYTVTVRDQNRCETKQSFSIDATNKNKLKLSIEQIPSGAGMEVLKITFVDGYKPYAVTIKNLSDGIKAPVLPYSGQALNNGMYLVEAFTAAGCSTTQKIKINEN